MIDWISHMTYGCLFGQLKFEFELINLLYLRVCRVIAGHTLPAIHHLITAQLITCVDHIVSNYIEVTYPGCDTTAFLSSAPTPVLCLMHTLIGLHLDIVICHPCAPSIPVHH